MFQKSDLTRRGFLKSAATAGISVGALGALAGCTAKQQAAKPGAKMQMGLVTYQWGKDWDLPTLIKNCETAEFSTVELRTHHAHGVEQ